MTARILPVRVLLPLLILLGSSMALAAGGPPDSARRGHGVGGNHDQLGNGPAEENDFAALERFLDMSDEQLERIQQAIARVRAMSPEERAALHEKLHAFRQLPPAQRERLRAGWRDNRDQADWPAMMRSLPDAERAAIQTEIQALAPAERAARKHELLEAWRSGAAPVEPSD